MKKIITLTICLALICSSVAPAFAAETITYFMDGNTSTRVSAYEVMTGIRTGINNIYNEFHNWVGTSGSGANDMTWKQFAYYVDSFLTDGDGVIFWTWEQVANELCNDGQVNPTNLTIKEILYVVSNFIVESFSSGGDMWDMTADIATTVNSINTGLMTYRNSFLTPKIGQILTAINKGLNTMPSFFEGPDNDRQYYLQSWNLDYTLSPDDESSQYSNFYWGSDTSKEDVIIMQLQYLTNNQYALDRWLLTDFDSQLSIWDSQGNTLSQSYWTPTSGFNGLYKYLAYTQRDVARLTHVYASDEEIAARDAARQNQTAVVNNFVDGNGVGSVSASDLGDMASVSGSLQSNFDTGASVSGVFAFFSNGSSTNWFSQATADALDTSNGSIPGDPDPDPGVDFSINPTRSNYSDTPLLDAYYEEIYDLLGIGDDNR